MEQPQEMKKNMAVVGIVSIVVAIIVIVIVVNLAQKRMSSDSMETVEDATSQVQTNEPVTGTMGLSVKGGKTNFRKGDQIIVHAYANSYKAKVTGYDVVVHYDPKQLAFNEVKSMQNGIDLLDTDLELDNGMHELIVTGVQSLSQQEPFVFDASELVEMTFTAVGTGTVNLNLEYEKGSNRESNLLDDSTNEILSGVEGVTLAIQ